MKKLSLLPFACLALSIGSAFAEPDLTIEATCTVIERKVQNGIIGRVLSSRTEYNFGMVFGDSDYWGGAYTDVIIGHHGLNRQNGRVDQLRLVGAGTPNARLTSHGDRHFTIPSENDTTANILSFFGADMSEKRQRDYAALEMDRNMLKFTSLRVEASGDTPGVHGKFNYTECRFNRPQDLARLTLLASRVQARKASERHNHDDRAPANKRSGGSATPASSQSAVRH